MVIGPSCNKHTLNQYKCIVKNFVMTTTRKGFSVPNFTLYLLQELNRELTGSLARKLCFEGNGSINLGPDSVGAESIFAKLSYVKLCLQCCLIDDNGDTSGACMTRDSRQHKRYNRRQWRHIRGVYDRRFPST